MQWNESNDHENKKVNKNACNALKSKVCYEILEYESKRSQIKVPLFCEFNLLKKYIC